MSRRVGLDIANQDSKTVIPDMISDGRRMRVVWRPGDGDGNPNQQIVTRYLNLVNGHPTWRIYTSNIKLPITRGSPEEPPHYCYLDDRACYAIYCSEAYTLKEKGEFWPSDFNKFGNIRKVRLNRGSKAYLEGSNMVLAQVKLRGLEKWYTFSGAPEVTEYEPSRPKQNAQIKGSVEQRYHEECERRVTHNTRFEKPVAEDAEPGVFPNETRTMLPTKQSLDEQYGSMYSSRNKISSPEVEVPAVLRSQQPIVQSSNASQQPTMTLSLSSTPKLSSPATSLGIPARLGTFNPKALLAKENAKRTNEGSPFTTNPRKRKLEATIDPNSVFLTDRTPRHSSTLVNNEVNGTEELSGVNQSKVINIDTNSDTELPAQVHLDAKESPDHLHLAKDEDLKHELEAVNAHLAAVTHERNIFRRVIIKLLAGKRYQQASVTEHIIALKKLSNSLDDFSFNAQKIAHSAKKEIEPSDALCEGVGTVLDGPGKLMYDNGMDEEWKVLRDEARKLAERYS